MIVDTLSGQSDFTSVHTLNHTAAAIWNYAAEAGDFTPRMLADCLCADYEVDPVTALADVTELLDHWLRSGLITD